MIKGWVHEFLEDFIGLSSTLFSGICDMSCIFLICILGGYFWMIGAIYCSNPNFMYITGALANGITSIISLNTAAFYKNLWTIHDGQLSLQRESSIPFHAS